MEADAPPLRGREREGGGAGADSPTPDREPESLIWKRKAGGTPTSEGESERGGSHQFSGQLNQLWIRCITIEFDINLYFSGIALKVL